MNVVVMGTGGTGGYFGGRLARAGERVCFVARGAHAEAIRRQGLTVRSEVDGPWTVKAEVAERLEGRPPADWVLFCVKAFDTEAAAQVIRPVVGPGTAVLPVQNGVLSAEILGRLLGPEHVLGGVAQVFATIAAPGVVHHVQLGRLILGELDGRESARVRAILAACQRAGIPAEASPDIRRALWEKYVFILAQAGATALTRCPVGVIRAVPETRRLFRLLAEEAVALARAWGVPVDPGFVDTVLGFLDAQRPGAFSSLHHDLVQGRRLELEALHGHAARLAERLGVPAPTITLVHAALRPYQDGPPAVPGG